MDKKHSKKIMSALCAVAVIIISLLYISFFLALAVTESVMWIISGIAILIYIVVCGGIIAALKERIKEINGGEEDEALKY